MLLGSGLHQHCQRIDSDTSFCSSRLCLQASPRVVPGMGIGLGKPRTNDTQRSLLAQEIRDRAATEPRRSRKSRGSSLRQVGRELLETVSTQSCRIGFSKLAQPVSFISLETSPLYVTAVTYLRGVDGGTPSSPADTRPVALYYYDQHVLQKFATLPAQGRQRLGVGGLARCLRRR